jgi:putative toxin-antitoxin system antitoxin component (TIGR02293 family)
MAIHARSIGRIREGRSIGRGAPIEGLLDSLGLPLRTVAQALAIPERTMHRLKHARIVPAVIADKVARTQLVLRRASEILGSRDAAQQWLVRANPALDGRTPLSLLDTSIGWERVQQVLGRIEHGVPA